MASATNPPIKVSGKPRANRFNCGAARVRTASATLVIISATMIGSESNSPAENILLPSSAKFSQEDAPSGVALTGIAEKLCASVAR